MKEKKVIFVLNNCKEDGKLTQLLSNDYIVSECDIQCFEKCEFDKKAADLVLLNTSNELSDSIVVLENLIKKEGIKDIPVILLADDEENDAEVMALQIGAMDYLSKPYKKAVLLGRIEKAIAISESKERLIKSANKDMLTGLWNRNYIENYIRNFSQNGCGKGVFMLLDMDNFKGVNDTFGHAIGDQVLIQISEALKCELNTDNILCRIGGDEFIIFLNEDVDAAKVRVLADRILDCVEDTIKDILNDKLNVSISIGIAGFPEDGEDFKTLYSNADKALYHVKQNGKRGFHFYRDKNTYSIKYHPEKNAIDIDELREYIKETTKTCGAYTVRYDGFKRIYQFILRCIERTGQDVQILIFTAQTDEWNQMANEEMDESITLLEQCVSRLLRKGDVVSKYSNSQVIVILMDSNLDNGKKVAERIKKFWQKKNKIDKFSVSYSIESVDRKKLL